MKRNRRAGVEDRWIKSVRDHPDGPVRTVPSAQHGRGLRYRARYVDDHGREHSKAFEHKGKARQWLDGQITALGTGTHVAPKDARMTVAEWCEEWLKGYAVNRDSTVESARTHIRQIVAEFGDLPLGAVRPSAVRAWTARLAGEGLAASYIHACHSRLSQVCADACHDGKLGRNPCSRRTSPPMGKAKVYVATAEQVWALYDAMSDHLKAAVLLGAFAGLRIAEVAALKVADVDFMRGVVHPRRQWPDKPLKTGGSDVPIPIPSELALMLSASVQAYGEEWMVTNGHSGPCAPSRIERAMREVRGKIDGLPETFTFHDYADPRVMPTSA